MVYVGCCNVQCSRYASASGWGLAQGRWGVAARLISVFNFYSETWNSGRKVQARFQISLKLSMFRAVKLQQLGRPASGTSVRLFLGSGGKRAKRGTGWETMREWGVPHNPTRNIDRNRLAHAARWVDTMAR